MWYVATFIAGSIVGFFMCAILVMSREGEE